MRISKLLLNLFFYLIWFQLFAQEPASINYTTKDGLISNNVYHVMQDSKGFIWISTDKGVSKYNGSEFINYGLNEGLDGEDVFLTVEDDNGNIWFCGIKSKLWYFTSDSIFPYEFNDTIIKYLSKPLVIKSLKVNKTGEVVIGSIAKGCLFIDAIGNAYKLNATVGKVVDINDKENILQYSVRSETSPHANSIGVTVVENGNHYSSKENFIDSITRNSLNFYSFYSEMDSSLYISSFNFLYKYKNNCLKVLKSFPNIIDCIYTDEKSTLYIGLIGGGITKLNLENDSIVKETAYFNKLSITSIFKDFNNNYYISTLNHGLIRLWGFDITQFNNHKLNVSDFKTRGNDTLYVSFSNGSLYKIIKNNFLVKELIKSSELRSDRSLYFEIICKDYPLILKDDFIREIVDSAKELDFGLFKVLPKLYYFVRNDLIYIASSQKMFLYNGELLIQLPIDLKKFNQEVKINSILLSPTDQLLIGTNIGLFNYDKNGLRKVKYYNEEINKLITLKNGYGIFSRFNYLDLIIGKDTIRNLDTEIIKSRNIGETQNSEILFASIENNLRLYKFKESFFFEFRNIEQFLPISEIKTFDFDVSYFWVLDETSIYRIPRNKKNILNIPVLWSNINSIRVNGEIQFDKVIKNNFVIDKGDNVKFNFISNGVQVNQKIKYEYRLLPAIKSWQSTKSKEVYYKMTNSGNYKFQIRAKTNGEENFSRISQIEFKVIDFIELNNWAIFILLSMSISVCIWLEHQYKNKKINFNFFLYRRKEEINLLKLQALFAKMNPHFTFNALNSLQSFILSESKINSMHFLNKYSRLLRKVLVSSYQKEGALKEELSLLERYIEIENIRFSGKINFSIEIESGLNIEKIIIPSMILQPVVENSIKHSFNSKLDEKYFIGIKVEKKRQYIEMSIFNNGVGIVNKESVKEIEGSNDKGDKDGLNTSFGLEIVKERLSIINGNTDPNKLFELKNVEKNNKVIGVLAIMRFPSIS